MGSRIPLPKAGWAKRECGLKWACMIIRSKRKPSGVGVTANEYESEKKFAIVKLNSSIQRILLAV